MSISTDSAPAAPAHQPVARGVLPSTLRTGWERAKVETRVFFRERDAIVFIFAYPVLMLGIFASVFGSQGAEIELPGGAVSIEFGQYFLPGMLATGIMLTSFQWLATAIAIERDAGTLKRLRGTPMPPASYFLGKIGQVVVVSLGQIAILLAFAQVAFGIPLPTSAAAWATFAWVFALGCAAGCVLGIAYSSLPRSGTSATAVVLPPVLVLQFISGVFFPFHDLPTWMQRVAEVFPLKWAAQGMRSVFLPSEAELIEVSQSWQHGPIAVILVAWTVVGLLLCLRTFRWQRRDAG